MRMAWVVPAVVGLFLSTAGAGAADTITQDVAGNEVTVTYLETSTTHNHVEGDGFEFTFHRESVTNGATVNDEGASLTVYNQSRHVLVDDGSIFVERSEETVGANLDANAAGYESQSSASAQVIDIDFDLGPNERGSTNHAVVQYRTNTYKIGEGAAGTNGGVTAGAGQLVTTDKGESSFGSVGVWNGGNLWQANTPFGSISTGHDARTHDEAWVGDWNGAEVSASYFLARCQGTGCSVDAGGVNDCVLGYQPPLVTDPSCVP